MSPFGFLFLSQWALLVEVLRWQLNAHGHLFAAAAADGSSAGALFCDIRKAYYNVIRQMVVGTCDADGALLAIFERLQFSLDTCREAIDFIHAQGSLVASGGASPELTSLLQAMNQDTWFVVDGSEKVTQYCKGARPCETIADLIFIFLFAKVTKEVRAILRETEFHLTLPYNSSGFFFCARQMLLTLLPTNWNLPMLTTSCMDASTRQLILWFKPWLVH